MDTGISSFVYMDPNICHVRQVPRRHTEYGIQAQHVYYIYKTRMKCLARHWTKQRLGKAKTDLKI